MRRRASVRTGVTMVAMLGIGTVLGSCASNGNQTAVSNGSVAPPVPGSGSTATTTATTNATPGSTSTPGTSSGSGSAASPVKATGAPRPSPGCSTPAPAAPDAVAPGKGADRTIAVDGKSHTFREFVPAGVPANQPLPLVLDLHGLREPHTTQALVSGWETLAATEHIVVLTPQGGDAIPNWSSTAADDNPDTAYLKALIEKAGQEHCIDESRTYAGGISNGGLESSILACKLPDQIAAVGLVSGIAMPPKCTDTPAKPAIIFWGQRDCVLPFYGGLGPCLVGPSAGTVPSSRPAVNGAVPPVEDNVATWAKRNGCGPDPTVTQVSEHVEKRTFSGCTNDAAVEFYVISNGGHTWPGSKAAATRDTDPDSPKGITTMEIDATHLMWEFFQRFQTAAP